MATDEKSVVDGNFYTAQSENFVWTMMPQVIEALKKIRGILMSPNVEISYSFGRQFLKIETMKYNFDKVIDRSGTSAEKVEGLKHIWGRTDLIPLWVADMDFCHSSFCNRCYS